MEHCSEGSQRLKLLFGRLAWRLCPWCMIASTIPMVEMTSDVDRASPSTWLHAGLCMSTCQHSNQISAFSSLLSPLGIALFSVQPFRICQIYFNPFPYISSTSMLIATRAIFPPIPPNWSVRLACLLIRLWPYLSNLLGLLHLSNFGQPANARYCCQRDC